MAVKKKPRPKRAKRPKPTYLPGLEPVSIPALDQAVETYYDSIQDRLPYTEKETEAHDNLQEKMIEHGQDRYETPDGLVAIRTSKSKCSVKRKKQVEPEVNGEASG